MGSVSVATLEGGRVQIDASDLDDFASGLEGSVVTTRDAEYEEVRAVWNAMIRRRPALIVRCAGAADVKRSIDFARERGLLTSVRGAGHNIAGNALIDDGLTIDLSEMRTVDVDPASRTVRVDPGATLGDLDAATAAHGLAVPVGINSTTGIAGLTLGGGFGWLSRKHGMTIDSLSAANVVTASGESVRASEAENPDLFWGLRGGGGNFGVVTSFEFQAHPVGPDLLCGLVVHPFADARRILQRYREFCATAPDDLTVWAVLRHAPPLPFLSEDVHGDLVLVLAFVYAGEVPEGESAIRPLREYGSPHGEHVGAMPFADFQQAFDPLLTPGSRNYWKSHNFRSLSDDALGVVLSYTERLPTPQSEIFIAQMGGATNRVPADATSYPHRDAEFIMNVHTRWEDAARDAECVAWAREFFDASTPFATGGVYSNFVSEAGEDDRVQASYGANFARLQALKQKFDPSNFFRVNQNIRPKD